MPDEKEKKVGSGVQAETLTRMSAEMLGIPLPEEHRPALVELLRGLAADIRPMAALKIPANIEPATIYDADEG